MTFLDAWKNIKNCGYMTNTTLHHVLCFGHIAKSLVIGLGAPVFFESFAPLENTSAKTQPPLDFTFFTHAGKQSDALHTTVNAYFSSGPAIKARIHFMFERI